MRRVFSGLVVVLLATSCGAAPEANEATVAAGATSTLAPEASTTTVTTASEADPVLSPAAPWAGAALDGAAVPAVLIDEWNEAGNRQWCSALFPADPTILASNATLRGANFGGGWGVAWDLPNGPGRSAIGDYCADCGRGAYGVAGTGLRAEGTEADLWPTIMEFDDGSIVGYGYEGVSPAVSGAPLLAYLIVKNEGCSYNVWSFLGEAHLQSLLSELRRVSGLEGEPTPWLAEIPPAVAVALGNPPWAADAIAADAVSSIAHEEWAESGSRSSCPMLFFADLGQAEDAVIRRASNSGEMLVAWDLSNGPGHSGDSTPCNDCGRGVVGLGTFPRESFAGPVAYTWSDGSEARLRTGPYSYGAEAFVQVTGFDCDYWLWTHLGQEHLESLLSQLRLVEGSP
jgi:hypothetical protein